MSRIAADVAAVPGAAELLDHYRRRQLSPVEVADAVLARIAACDRQVNAFVLVDADAARSAAQASERRWRSGAPRGRLDGIPVTIKDMNDVRGWPTRRGSRVTGHAPATSDSVPVARLREHGAVLVGKTTTPEFGWQGVTESPLTGITRNPWDLGRTPGGSSGGAAVAAALSLGVLHLGGDGGGSIRIPAALTGVFGIKPTFGLVGQFPQHSPLRLTQAGPLTRTVADAALMLAVIGEPDARDWMALPPGQVDDGGAMHAGIRGWRVAYCAEFGAGKATPAVLRLVDEAAATLAGLGAEVEPIADPIGSRAALFTRYWHAAQATLQHQRSALERSQMDAGLVRMLVAGERLGFLDFAAAMRERVALGEAITALFTRYDLLLTPSLPITAFAVGQGVPDPVSMQSWIDWAPYSYPFNLSGHPAASCPCGFTADGLPVGLQIVGPMYGDAHVLGACRAFERERPFRMPEMPCAIG